MTVVLPHLKALAGAALYSLAVAGAGLVASATAVHAVVTREPAAVVTAAEDLWFNAEADAVVLVRDLQARLLP
jgi:hypothetical protein